MRQTAVQWYAERLYDLEMAYNQGVIKTNTYIKGKREAVEQAKEMEKEQMIDFSSWLAKSEWMSIWVFDEWLWTCQKENSNTNYKTDKELFDIYYNETYGGNK